MNCNITYTEDLVKEKIFKEVVSGEFRRVGLDKKARRLRICGEEKTLVCQHCGYKVPVKLACGLRTCPECARRMSQYFVNKFYDVLKTLPITPYKKFRMITLTTDLTISEDSIKTIRRWQTKMMSKIVKKGEGAVTGIEVGEQGKKLHIHALHYGKFVEQAKLVELWEKITQGRGKVVDVRIIKDQEKSWMLRKGLKEVLKYSVKLTALEPYELAELELALEGTRRIATYGIFYNLYRWIRAEGKSKTLVCPQCGRDDCWVYEENLEYVMGVSSG